MTIHEASERCCIPPSIPREYESRRLCGAMKRGLGAWQYDDQDLEQLSRLDHLRYEIQRASKKG